MISSFMVYLVMQLDTFIGMLIATVIICGFVVFFSVIGILMYSRYDDEDYRPLAYRGLKWATIVGALSGVLIAITPNTKTAAAMVILPLVTGDVVISEVKDEAGELYDLTKDALRELIERNKNSEKPEKE